MTETMEETVTRLLESRDLLFKHTIKFGRTTRCHARLFRDIDDQLRKIGVDIGNMG